MLLRSLSESNKFGSASSTSTFAKWRSISSLKSAKNWLHGYWLISEKCLLRSFNKKPYGAYSCRKFLATSDITDLKLSLMLSSPQYSKPAITYRSTSVCAKKLDHSSGLKKTQDFHISRQSTTMAFSSLTNSVFYMSCDTIDNARSWINIKSSFSRSRMAFIKLASLLSFSLLDAWIATGMYSRIIVAIKESS